MSKELEIAIKIIKNETLYDSSNNRCPYVKDLPQWHVIEKALTPPTEQEVCEALGEYFKKMGYLKRDIYYLDKTKAFYVGNEINEALVWLDYNGDIETIRPYPPRIIKILGEFYEGRKQ